MDIVERIRQRVLRFLRIGHLAEDPSGERFTFVSDMGGVARERLEEYRVWYKGDGDELLNYYTSRTAGGFARDPIYNRNKSNYFWAISSQEASIKRVHSGIPKAIVDTLTNVIGVPEVSCKGIEKSELSSLLDGVRFKELLNQEQIPLTLAMGWGAFKISIDPSLSPYPIVRFYQAKDVDFVARDGIVMGLIFKDYYRASGKDYVLLETRRRNERGNCAIEYDLYRLGPSGRAEPAPLSDVPSLSSLSPVEIPDYKGLLAVPSRFLKDPDDPDLGRSILAGKIDLFDDLDQSLSQRSQTDRVSTPVEYYPADLLQYDRNGNAILPTAYNRQFMQKPGGTPDGDGARDAEIQTTQPELNFDQYTDEQNAILTMILTGILSPATLGIDLSKRDNAEAQREKEKVTIMTRNNVVSQEILIVRSLIQQCLDALEYMKTGSISLEKREVSVKFPTFANPAFESIAPLLSTMWQGGAISTPMYVEKLYGDTLSDEEKAEEIEWLDEKAKEELLPKLEEEWRREAQPRNGEAEEKQVDDFIDAPEDATDAK